MLSVDDPRQLPVIQAGDLSDQVAEAGYRHPIRSGFENIRIPDDQLRRVRLHGLFEIVDIHNADGGGKPVHRSSGCDGKTGPVQLIAGKADHIRDGSRADADHQIAVFRKIQNDLTEGRLVKTGVLQDQDPAFDPGFPQKLFAALSGDLKGDLVTDDIGVGISKLFGITRQCADRPRTDLDRPDRNIVLMPAGALQLYGKIVLQFMGRSVHDLLHVFSPFLMPVLTSIPVLPVRRERRSASERDESLPEHRSLRAAFSRRFPPSPWRGAPWRS